MTARPRRRVLRAILILLAFGLLVRVAVLLAFVYALGGIEINDDYLLYEEMTARPASLLTGFGADALGDSGIYAPLIPVQLWFPGKLISRVAGDPVGRRLGMLAYDLVALAITLVVAVKVVGPPETPRQWAAALALTVLPASVGASVLWGQEDSASALWAALSLACFVWVGPTVAMVAAGAGLFTSKMFVVVLMAGIWLAAGARRAKAALAGVGCVLAFSAFLLLRWLASGYLYPDYHYNAMSNSPSIWAAYYLLFNPVNDDTPVRPYVKIVVLVAMLAFVAVVWRRRLTVWQAVVAAHAVFFASFIGIHPEHYQWFLPFLIVYSWDAFRRGRWTAFAAALAVTCLPYAYKIVYGLRGPAGQATGGKRAIRAWFEAHIGLDLWWAQLVVLFATLGTLLLLASQALHESADEAVDTGVARR